jgi:predicted metal-dependent TIM-barrel fold hydrolase
MAKAGIAAIIEPAFWTGQPRTHPESFEDYFLSLLGWERFRASQFGIHHFCTLSLNPKEANNILVADGVIDLLPRYLEKDGVVGIGEIGYDDQTAAEEKYLDIQLKMAKDYNLPVLIHTPHRDKKNGTQRIIDKVKEHGLPANLVLVDHNTELTLADTLDAGYWAGHSIYPFTKMTEERMVELINQYGSDRIIVNSAADWGVSDPLKVASFVTIAREKGMDEAIIEKVVWNNPIEFFAQSGRLDMEAVETRPRIDQTQLFEGSSVLRGQTPKVDD